MLLFQIQGKTQAQCAEFFGVSDRTIRNWNRKLKDIIPSFLQDINPGAEALAVLYRFTVRESKLLKWEQEAEDSGDSKIKILCNKELRLLDQERRAFLNQIGLFSKLQINFDATRDPTEESAILVQTALLNIMQAAYPPDISQIDKKEV